MTKRWRGRLATDADLERFGKLVIGIPVRPTDSISDSSQIPPEPQPSSEQPPPDEPEQP